MAVQFDVVLMLWLDAIHTVNGDSAPYRDNPPDPNFAVGPPPQDQQPFSVIADAAQLNQPAIQAFSSAIRSVADEYGVILMGEVDGDDARRSAVFTARRLHTCSIC